MIETALKRLGHKILWSEVPWKHSLETAKQGMVDILPRHSMNEERKTFLHAIAYGYKVRKIFYMISPKKDIIINSLDDLLPYTVGMLRGSFYSQTFAEDKRLTKLPFGSNDQMIRLLESGRLDIAITSSAHELEKFIDIKGIKQAHYSDSFFNSRNISIPARSPMVKHFAAFKHEIEKIIRSGEIEDIFKRHNISAPSQKD
jgi:polar amino acid transport system substrate-binding protein